MLDLINITQTYIAPKGPTIVALSGLNLRVSAGELVAVVGPSGSGKSTLLHTAAALLQPDGGQVLVDGIDVYALTPRDRSRLRRERVGFVFQTFNLVPYLSCVENVMLPMLLADRPQADARRMALSSLDRLGVAHRSEHLPASISVGERQRVAICRAIANAPGLLLADEPTGNLDASATDGVMEVLRGIAATGHTVVIATHDERVAAACPRKLHLMPGGALTDSSGMADASPHAAGMPATVAASVAG